MGCNQQFPACPVFKQRFTFKALVKHPLRNTLTEELYGYPCQKNEACHSESVYCVAAGEKITVKEIAERAEINKTTFYSHYETLDALTAEMERQTVQLVCDNMGGAQQLLDAPETFVQEMFAALQQATDYLGVVPASAMNRFTQHLRDAILEQIKLANMEPSQYENVGAILIFVMNGLSGLLNTDAKLAQKQIDVIAAVVADGVHGLHLSH